MANLKLKYSLKEANEKIVELKGKFPVEAQREYMHLFNVGNTTLWKYLNGNVPSPIAANHLAEYMDDYVKKNHVAA